MPLSSLLEGLAKGGGKNGKPEVGLFQAKRRKDRLKPFKFGPSELAELAVGLRAYVTSKRETSAPVTSWSNLLARKWPREYALAKQAAGFKCTAQKVREAIDANLLNRYGSVWQWQGGGPRRLRSTRPVPSDGRGQRKTRGTLKYYERSGSLQILYQPAGTKQVHQHLPRSNARGR